jgi:hypothetical protein
MTWEPPEYIEINMSAEIGGYQDDFEERPLALKDRVQPGDFESLSNEAKSHVHTALVVRAAQRVSILERKK